MGAIPRAIRAAYTLEGDDETWIDRVAHAMRGFVAGDRGVCAFSYRLGPSGPEVDSPRVVGVDRDTSAVVVQVFETAIAAVDPAIVRAVLSAPRRPLQTTSEIVGRDLARRVFESVGAPLAIGDFVGGRVATSDSEGYILGSFVATAGRLGRESRAEITRLLAHVEAASRLRRIGEPVATIAKGRATDVRDEDVRAALPSLHDVHPHMIAAEGGARGLASWPTRVEARYSLVATGRDGEATVLRNDLPHLALPEGEDVRVHGVAKLLAEGHPQKLIAYELGIPEGSVYRHVARLKKMLGEPTTVGLVARLGALAPSPWEEDPAKRDALLAALSPGERFVVEGALRGLSAAAMAKAREVSVRTTENVLRGAYRKLGVGSRKELAAKLGRA